MALAKPRLMVCPDFIDSGLNLAKYPCPLNFRMPEVHRPQPDRRRPLTSNPWFVASLVMAAGCAAKLYTNFVWEDFLITFRFSENLAAGRGFVYNPGEKVFGFTSPLNGVLPALFKWLIHGDGYAGALWGFVFASLGVWAWGLASLARHLDQNATPNGRSGAGLLIAFSLLQAKLMVFTISGQESGLWAGFLLLALCAQEEGRWKAVGVAWGGLLWTRPDSPVQIALLVFSALVFSGDSLKATVRSAATAAAIAAAIYAPWAIATSLYYGSPIPTRSSRRTTCSGSCRPPTKHSVSFRCSRSRFRAVSRECIARQVDGRPG
jgi:hypothetical protein